MSRFILPIITLIGGLAAGYWLLPAAQPSAPAQSAAASEDEILYWVAPMDASFRRDKPGKSPMGMDLVPVYANQSDASQLPGTVSVSAAIEQSLGVTTSRAEHRPLTQSISATGVIELAEDKLIHIHPRVSGWIETLAITNDGQAVTRGDTLYTLYSPELVNAQEEYLLARARGSQSLINAARTRLSALQFPDALIEQLNSKEQVMQRVAFKAPQTGFVTNLNVRPGFYVQPGTTMMEIASLEDVWLHADVPQRFASAISEGDEVNVSVSAYPERQLTARVDFIYPQLNARTRTLKVRLALANSDSMLKPDMFAAVRFATSTGQPVLSVPRSALIRTASNTRVVLALGDGKYRSASVTVGRLTPEFAEITAGLSAGDEVVTNGLFLIDSESAIDADLDRITPSATDDSQWLTVTVDAVDTSAGTVTAQHPPVDAWNWPAMTMDFALADSIDSSELSAGMTLRAELTRTDGMARITDIDRDSIQSSAQSATVEGVINEVMANSNIINISRGPIEKWGRGPATMDFVLSEALANPVPAASTPALTPGQSIRFTFEIRGDDFVITHIESPAEPVMDMSQDMNHDAHH
ncbi:efflux RND transporter periplasmic adaptor subunit [Alteromonas gilva]|uniref:Efflux RND transporter periplasmic adaptor subunit n=1 Tax=Alteromonas gilva TaxID=2987522 RepID=A0ABT5L7Y5_9ALTE|nr:efflux RND transporter periplasmic adaptor subunit [Alteromonas gilva]MDC8832616.1 efflux RND transporter periplasmic adaptor subunit [Alteromonas gilva]